MEQVLENIYRIEIPLPKNPLKALYSYLVVGDKRNLLIDTGFNHPECEKAMRNALDAIGISMDDTDIFLTHLHADHTGLTSKLMTPTTKVYIEPGEGRTVNAFLTHEYWAELLKFQDYMGMPKNVQLERNIHPAHKYCNDFAIDFVSIQEGDVLTVGKYRFEAVDLAGHTPGQLGLWDAAQGLLISGDHILAKITPNIGLWDFKTDYLGLFMDNLRKVRNMPVKILLSAHRQPVENVNQRIDELLKHHENRLNEACEILMTGEKCVYDVSREMKWDYGGGDFEAFPAMQKWFAAMEVFAHLEHLYRTGRVLRKVKKEVYIYYLPSV